MPLKYLFINIIFFDKEIFTKWLIARRVGDNLKRFDAQIISISNVDYV